MATSFRLVVGLEHYVLACTSPVSVQGEPVAFGEPAYVDVAGIKYWCHFDPDAYLPEDADEPTPDQLADAVDQAAGEKVPVYQVGHGNLSPVVMLENGFPFEEKDGDDGGEPGDDDGEDEGDDEDDGEGEDLNGVDELTGQPDGAEAEKIGTETETKES